MTLDTPKNAKNKTRQPTDPNALLERTRAYRQKTREALAKIRFLKHLSKKERDIGEDFLDMAQRYYADGEHFEKNNNLDLALTAYAYAHAWLDAGVRARIFDAQGDDRLFTLPKNKPRKTQKARARKK